MTPEPDAKSIEKANDYGVEAMKQVMVLASGSFAISVSLIGGFLKEENIPWYWLLLLVAGWASLLCAALLAWLTITTVANTLAENALSGRVDYLFTKKRGEKKPGRWSAVWRLVSWFWPFAPTRQSIIRRMAASTQCYFIIGFSAIAAFAAANILIAPASKADELAELRGRIESEARWHYDEGERLMRGRARDEALRHWQAALALKPGYPPAQEALRQAGAR